MKKTFYELDLSAFMCCMQISVNDVEILSLDIEGQTVKDAIFPLLNECL